MEQQALIELATFLAEHLPIQVPEHYDPLDPNFLIQVLATLFPSSSQLWGQISEFDPQEQWNAVLEFVEINMLAGNALEMQTLGIRQLIEIYSIVAEYVQNQIEEQEQKELMPISKHPSHPRKDNTTKDKNKKKIPIEEKKDQQQAGLTSSKQAKKKGNQSQIKKEVLHQHPQSRSKQNHQKHPEKGAEQNKNQKSEKGKIQQKDFQKELQDKVVNSINKALHKMNPKTDDLFRDTKGVEAVKKADRQFAHFLKEYKRDKVLKRNLHPLLRNKNPRKTTDQLFLKIMEQKQKALQEEVTGQQLKYLLALRDRKLAFVNKIHRLTEQLEKERQIDWAHQQRQLVLEHRSKTAQEIAKTEAVFETNMQLLKEQYNESRNRGAGSTRDELAICREMGRALEGRKKEEMERMRVLWEQENAKLSSIVGDEERVKNKLIDLYRKNRP